MKTQNLYVEDLSSTEMMNVSGGVIGFVLGLLITVAVTCLDDLDSYNRGFNDGYNGGN